MSGTKSKHTLYIQPDADFEDDWMSTHLIIEIQFTHGYTKKVIAQTIHTTYIFRTSLVLFPTYSTTAKVWVTSFNFITERLYKF